MSVRAYKVIKLVVSDSPSFNCWHDGWIFNMAETDAYSDGGFLNLERVVIEEKLDELQEDKKNGMMYMDTDDGSTSKIKLVDKIDFITIDEAIKMLKDILKDFKKDEDYQLYECY